MNSTIKLRSQFVFHFNSIIHSASHNLNSSEFKDFMSFWNWLYLKFLLLSECTFNIYTIISLEEQLQKKGNYIFLAFCHIINFFSYNHQLSALKVLPIFLSSFVINFPKEVPDWILHLKYYSITIFYRNFWEQGQTVYLLTKNKNFLLLIET